MTKSLPKITGMKSCPFCGYTYARVNSRNVAHRGPSVRTQKHYVVCHKCHAKGPYALSYEEAISKWNTNSKARVLS